MKIVKPILFLLAKTFLLLHCEVCLDKSSLIWWQIVAYGSLCESKFPSLSARKAMPCNAVSRRLDTHIQRLWTAITSNHLRAAASHSYTAVMRNFRLIRRLSRTIAAEPRNDVTRRENPARPTESDLLHFDLSRRVASEGELSQMS